MGKTAVSNQLSNEVLAQLFSQSSDDPFLSLVTLDHESFDAPIRLVNNTVNIVSRGETYLAFPMKITLPSDDGETTREFNIDFDNASLELIQEIRSVTTAISAKVELILASLPDVVQMSQDNLLMTAISYTSKRVTARMVLDNFLNVSLSSESYTPSVFPGLF